MARKKNHYGQHHFTQSDVRRLSRYAAGQKIPFVPLRKLTRTKRKVLLFLASTHAEAVGFLQGFIYETDADRRARNGEKINECLRDLRLARTLKKLHFS